MQKTNFRFAATLLLVCMGIYAARVYRARLDSKCMNLCKYTDDTIRLNSRDFQKSVVPLLESPRKHNLIVFVNPGADCLACLFETEYWLAPSSVEDDYKVFFLIPQIASTEHVTGYINQFLLEEDQIIRFEPNSPLVPYNRFGVLKVFYELEAGIRWFEFGNREEDVQLAFPDKILATIRQVKRS